MNRLFFLILGFFSVLASAAQGLPNAKVQTQVGKVLRRLHG